MDRSAAARGLPLFYRKMGTDDVSRPSSMIDMREKNFEYVKTKWSRIVQLWILFVTITSISNVISSEQKQPLLADHRGLTKNFDRLGSGHESFITTLIDDLKNAQNEVELTISAMMLEDLGFITRSYPYCVISTKLVDETLWTKCDETEFIYNDVEVKWKKKPKMQFSFGEQQLVRFEIFHYDGNKTRKALGYTQCNLEELIKTGTMQMSLQKTDKNGKTVVAQGKITIKAEKLTDNEDVARIELSGHNIGGGEGKNWLGQKKAKPHPYMTISRVNESDDWEFEVTKTEVVHNNESPKWETLVLPLESLRKGYEKRTIVFACYDWNKRGKYFIGQFSTTIEELCAGNINSFELKIPNQKNESFGRIFIKFKVIKVPTFAEFMRGGLKIHYSIALDFSEVNEGESLHRIGDAFNQYEEAINAVVSKIEGYNMNKQYSVYGFAAKYPRDSEVCDVFNLKSDDSPCFGVQGVLDAYRKCLDNITPATSTNFAPVIEKITQSIKPNESQNYHILLIFTNGQINDLPITETVIRQASMLPLSIIVVGIGNSTFPDMVMLNRNLKTTQEDRKTTGTTSSRGDVNTTTRDIVQFVTFEEFRSLDDHNNNYDTSFYLARKLLDEIPKQVESYMRAHNFKPAPEPHPGNNDEPQSSLSDINSFRHHFKPRDSDFRPRSPPRTVISPLGIPMSEEPYYPYIDPNYDPFNKPFTRPRYPF